MTTGTKVRWALLAACLAYGLVALLAPGGGGWGPRGFHSNQKTALIQMHNFGAAIDAWVRVHKQLPVGLGALAQSPTSDPEPFLREIPNDPWDNPYDYEIHGPKTYLLRSRGEDGLPDTEDDILWPEAKK